MARDEENAHEVLLALRQIQRRISEHSKYLSREVGLTVPQLLCLKAIGDMVEEHDEITVAMVGERVQLSAATASRVIDKLTLGGLVIRERRSKDRRRVCLSLTSTGQERFETLPTPLHESFVERFEALDEQEQQSLFHALYRIVELMGATEFDAAPMLAADVDVMKPS